MLFSDHVYSSPTDLEAKDLRFSYSISWQHSWLKSYKVSHYLLVYDSRKPSSWPHVEDKVFKVRMDGAQGTLIYCLIWWVATLPTTGRLGLHDLWGPFQLKPFCGLSPWGLFPETSEEEVKWLPIQPVARGNQASEEYSNNHAWWWSGSRANE